MPKLWVEKNTGYTIPDSLFMENPLPEVNTGSLMMFQMDILKTKERYPVLHSTYDGLHYSESITKGKLQKLKKYLEEDVILWK